MIWGSFFCKISAVSMSHAQSGLSVSEFDKFKSFFQPETDFCIEAENFFGRLSDKHKFDLILRLIQEQRDLELAVLFNLKQHGKVEFPQGWDKMRSMDGKGFSPLSLAATRYVKMKEERASLIAAARCFNIVVTNSNPAQDGNPLNDLVHLFNDKKGANQTINAYLHKSGVDIDRLLKDTGCGLSGLGIAGVTEPFRHVQMYQPLVDHMEGAGVVDIGPGLTPYTTQQGVEVVCPHEFLEVMALCSSNGGKAAVAIDKSPELGNAKLFFDQGKKGIKELAQYFNNEPQFSRVPQGLRSNFLKIKEGVPHARLIGDVADKLSEAFDYLDKNGARHRIIVANEVMQHALQLTSDGRGQLSPESYEKRTRLLGILHTVLNPRDIIIMNVHDLQSLFGDNLIQDPGCSDLFTPAFLSIYPRFVNLSCTDCYVNSSNQDKTIVLKMQGPVGG
jgi:hypothetical protein